MFKKAVLVSLVIFSTQFVQASQQFATPMSAGSAAACPRGPHKRRIVIGRRLAPNFGAKVYPRWQMELWADHNSGDVPSVISPTDVSAKLRARAVFLAIATSNAALAYTAK